MESFPYFLLDSGDPDEFREISQLAQKQGGELWGATTNPTLIAKKLAGPSTSLRVNQKISEQKAFELQKEIVLEIIDLVPGAVSAEVYADKKTSSDEMIEQGREIGSWHKRVVVKLPTTVAGFHARTALRREKIPTNNTLVFSQQQIFAVCLHERIIQEEFGFIDNPYPPFISPFVGRLDDGGEDGMAIVEHGMEMKKAFGFFPWILQASSRRAKHIQRGIEAGVELITAPAEVWREWFTIMNNELPARNASQNDAGWEIMNHEYAKELKKIPYWEPPQSLVVIPTIKAFLRDLETRTLDISHPLTEAGLKRFADDWKQIIKNSAG